MHNSEGLIVMTNDNEHKLKDLIVMGALTTDQGIKSTASTYNHQPCDQKIQHRQQVNDAYPRPWLPRKPTETPEHHPVHWPNSKMDRRHRGKLKQSKQSKNHSSTSSRTTSYTNTHKTGTRQKLLGEKAAEATAVIAESPHQH